MRQFTKLGSVLALAMMASPVQLAAQSQANPVSKAKGLACMESSYSSAQRGQIAELGAQTSYGGQSGSNAALDQLGNLAMGAVEQCISRLGWNEELAMYAAFYELGRLNNIAYRASGELTPVQLQQIDEALATGDRTRLWEAIERGLMSGMTGNEGASAPGDAVTMGAFVLGAGLGEDQALAEKVGYLLGFMGLQRMGEREFTALQ